MFKGLNVSNIDAKLEWPVELELFGSSNSSSKELLVDTYQRKPLWRKISDEKVKVQQGGPALIISVTCF